MAARRRSAAGVLEFVLALGLLSWFGIAITADYATATQPHSMRSDRLTVVDRLLNKRDTDPNRFDSTGLQSECICEFHDGVMDNTIGLTGGGLMGWSIPCQADVCQWVNGVDIAWGYVPANTSAQILVQDDPNNDGDPGDAATIICVDVLTQQEDTGVLVHYPLSPIEVSGAYFITVVCGHQAGEFPAGLDQTTSQGTSWVVWGCPDPCDPYCSGATYDLIDAYNLPGNWMITAHSADSPLVGKYEQPINCDDHVWFSNLNSNENPYLRYDDFVCQQTGWIGRIEFWGQGFDLDTWHGCGVPDLTGFQVDLYQWTPGGECGWLPGELLCSNTIPMDTVDWEYVCTGPNGDYYRIAAGLPQPCYQVEGEHYVLLVAGILDDPDDPCIFGWAATYQISWSPAASYHRIDDDWECGGPDQAFALHTEWDPCPADVNGDGVVNLDDLFEVVEHWGPCDDPADCPWDLVGPGGPPDGIVNIDDVFYILALWGPCP